MVLVEHPNSDLATGAGCFNCYGFEAQMLRHSAINNILPLSAGYIVFLCQVAMVVFFFPHLLGITNYHATANMSS